MNVFCPQCGKMLSAEDMNLDQMVGRCQHCHALVNLWNYVQRTEAPSESAPPKRAPVPRPEDLIVEDSGSQLRIYWRWYSWHIWPSVPFHVAYWSILVWVWATVGIPWPLSAILILFVVAGVEATYSTLGYLLNRTEVLVDHETLQVRHGPLPWSGNRVLAVNDITQLYVVNRGRETSNHRRRKRNIRSKCALFALCQDGVSRKLLQLDSAEKAWFLKQQIEDYLGIPDHPVGDELTRQ